MNIEPINFSDFDLVEIKNGTPHCKKHGAMNKMNVFEDGGGYWRCITYVTKQNDTACRAGCCEKITEPKVINFIETQRKNIIDFVLKNTKSF